MLKAARSRRKSCAATSDPRTRDELRAAIAAEFSGDCAFEIVAFELARLTLRVSKTVHRHQHEHVRRAAGKILARTTMTLRPQHRRSHRFVANLAAVRRPPPSVMGISYRPHDELRGALTHWKAPLLTAHTYCGPCRSQQPHEHRGNCWRNVSSSHRTAPARAAKSLRAASPNSVRKFIPPLWAYSIVSRRVRFGAR